ncbi:MAG TPA: TetR family transcriptional regulator [Sporichthyaceae bacterium]
MPRPSQALLSRKSVVAAALRIIDNEGLAACSTLRLAREFGVRAPSLYHHFTDRADIMAEVARVVVRETPFPRERNPERWMDWFIEQAINFRRTILKHPNVAPILLEFLPRDQLSALYDNAATLLAEANVPVEVHALILDGLETLTVGSALITAMKAPGKRTTPFSSVHRATDPALAAAVDANPWPTSEELFAEVVRAMLRGALESVGVAAGNARRSR